MIFYFGDVMEKELELFNNYVKNYDLDIPMLGGKYKHTFRVLEYAKEIAKSLHLNEEMYNLACVSALFHDIGRFIQYDKYHTFIDSKSIDHGNASKEILEELGYNNEIVLDSVLYHNKINIPSNWNDDKKTIAYIVRDADKIDIMLKQLLSIEKKESKVPDELFDYFKRKELLPNDIGEGVIIGILRHLAFIFDIKYKKSIEILLKENIIERKLEILKDYISEEHINEIRNSLNDYIECNFN